MLHANVNLDRPRPENTGAAEWTCRIRNLGYDQVLVIA
jgi:hypothetical protein